MFVEQHPGVLGVRALEVEAKMGQANQLQGARWITRVRENALALAIAAVVIVISALAVTRNNADADLWGHVQYGRDVLSSGRLPATTTYSFTAEGYRWINHENLAELFYAWAFGTFGVVPVVILKSLLGYTVLAGVVWHARRSGAGWPATLAVLLLTAVNLTLHWSMRPQLFTYVFYAFMLAWLTWCFDGWQGHWQLPLTAAARHRAPPLQYSIRRLRALWVLPVVFFVWGNTHGGFVAGYCLFAGYLGLRSIEAIARRGRAAWGLVARFGMMIFAGGLATLVNPYSFRLQAWLIDALSRPWPEISEWHGPSFSDPMSRPWWILVAATIVTVATSRRPYDFTHLGVLAVTFWQASVHQRHVPFYAIAFGYWMTPHVQAAIDRICPEGPGIALRAIRGRTRLAAIGLATVTCLLLLSVIVRRNTDLTVYRSEYPVSALEFMAEQQLQGNMVVTYDWAQYVIAAFGACEPGQRGVRVAFDGRFNTCYPQHVIDMHFDFALGNLDSQHRYRESCSGPFDPLRVLDYAAPPYDPPDLVLVARRQQHAVKTIESQQRDWVLLYQDDVAQLWGRASKYDDIRSPEYVAPELRVLAGAPQIGSVTWPALPPRRCAKAPLVRSAPRKKPSARSDSITPASHSKPNAHASRNPTT